MTTRRYTYCLPVENSREEVKDILIQGSEISDT